MNIKNMEVTPKHNECTQKIFSSSLVSYELLKSNCYIDSNIEYKSHMK
jgi:hypothetical protein